MAESDYKFGDNGKVNADVRNAANFAKLNRDGETALRRMIEDEKGGQTSVKRENQQYDYILELARYLYEKHAKYRK